MNGLASLFGTDGVRGVANVELTPELAFRLGRAAAAVLAEGARGRHVVVGRDSRRSGSLLEAALAAGITSVGLDVRAVGVIPTPGVAYLTRHTEAAFGVMISASHNPPADNGIKLFAADGFKLNDEAEAHIERLVLDGEKLRTDVDDGLPRPAGDQVGQVEPANPWVEKYVEFLERTAGVRLDGMRIVVDCAHGAAGSVAPSVLRRLGAEVIALHDEFDGLHINVDCGSTHPEKMLAAVVEHGADVGIAHDGDADRVIMADAAGQLVDGDAILAVCGLHMHEAGLLQGNAIAATAYSNLGLKLAFERRGARVVETAPGDRYVLQAMLQHGLILGGEQSGHIIFLEHNTTGDGVLAALQVLRVMRQTGKPLAELAQALQRVPQLLVNVPVRDKGAFAHNGTIRQAIAQAQADLGETGRLFVRPSGTEPLIRVMAESTDERRLKEVVERVAAVIEAELS